MAGKKSHLAITILALLSALPAAGEEWARFRGPNGSGVSSSRGLPIEFGPQTNLAWAVDIPFGRSSLALTSDRIFLTAVEAENLLTLAVDRASGKILWQRALERGHEADLYQGTDSATPTPVTDGKNVYVFFHEAGLVSYDGVGTERWRVPLGPFRNFYGIAASPVLAGDTLLLLCDQSRGSFLLALDKNSGNELWRQDRPARLEAYSTPVLFPDADRPSQVLVGGSRWVDAYDLRTGESAWSMTGVGTGPVASPVLAGGRLFVNAPDHAPEPPQPFSEITGKYDANQDGVLQKAELDGFWMFNHFGFADVDGNGAISAQDWETLNSEMVNDNWGLFAMHLPSDGGQPQILWNQRKGVPYIPSVLVYDGVLYMVKDSIVTSLDPETGEVFKQGRLEGASKVYASPIAGDGNIYIATLDGRVIVLGAGEQWEVRQENELGDPIHATPAIAGRSLFVRTKSRLYSFAQSSE